MKRKAASPPVLTGRKRRRVGTNLVKKIKSVVYNTIKKQLETKRVGYNDTATFFDRQFRISNPIFPITTGSTSSNRDGNEIHLTGISVKTEATNFTQQDVTHHVAVISADALHNGLMSLAVIASEFIYNTSSHPNLWRFDSDRCTVHASRIFKTSGGANSIGAAEKNETNKFYVKFNRKLTWNNSTGYIDKKNIYVVYWASVPTGGVLTTTMSSDIQVYFKA